MIITFLALFKKKINYSSNELGNFLFALISYSSWYYLNITKDTNIKARIADNPNNQNKFSYVKIEEEKSNLHNQTRDNNSIDKNISVEDEIANLNNNKSNVDTGPNN